MTTGRKEAREEKVVVGKDDDGGIMIILLLEEWGERDDDKDDGDYQCLRRATKCVCVCRCVRAKFSPNKAPKEARNERESEKKGIVFARSMHEQEAWR